MAIGVSGGLVKCGRCGKRYSNPLTHICTGRRRGRTRPAPKISAGVKCPRCGQRYANPLAHVCASKRGDFGRRRRADEKHRKAEAAKAKRAARPPQHEYSECGDDSCTRFPCRVYREGQRSGYDKGFDEGEAEGHDTGYREGFPDGLASCPGPHGGG